MFESSQQSGFTLMETVVAMGVFAVGLMGLAMMTSGLMSNNSIAHQRAVATQLAQNKMEMLGREEYEEIAGSLEEKLDASDTSGSGVFSREVSVEERTDPVCKEVTVKVLWEAKGKRRVVLRTIFAP
jgi:prepilin-type N-terminal cleavage/methylation domain-containing protein